MDQMTADAPELLRQAQQKDEERAIASSDSALGGQDFLYGVIGARLQGNANAPAADSGVQDTMTQMLGSDTVAAFGKRYYERIKEALRNLLCGDDEDGKAVREKLSKAGLNATTISTILTGAIAAAFGTSLIVAAAVAALIVYLFVSTGEKAICDIWKSNA